MSTESNHFSDKVIVTNILNGNVQGFALVVKDTEKLITQIVRKMTTNADDQKDLVQDIYLKAYKNLPNFKFQSKLSTWIANIAYNTTVNYLQKKRIPIIEIETTIAGNFIVTENAEVETIKTEALEILTKEIAKLPPLYKTLITLYHLEELPNKEIAEITNLPEGTIKSYLSRARKMLKDNMNYHY
ncbi:RNA polymerase sigma factor [Lacihabitans sp. LS3-19]|uniref:RNA polymerase sigma factor n=1 Tax=Lacihabitans sp. LS3-19 TaxID=2487335 RepID=UPI0020CD4B66|nr:RNA polymerase sigma factor [Lacihabitans sp. LS3-19]MCP9769086.1 RNA polymerase sigma factor [Lacihabitans sp. LS3-19]